MTIWMDLTNSLTQHKGNVVGIIRSELMQAKMLHEIDPSIKYSVLTQFGFREVKPTELKWLFKSDNVGDDYLKYQHHKKLLLNRLLQYCQGKIDKKLFKIKRRKRHRSIPKNEFLIYPYQDGDVIYSCGWFGTEKEKFFNRISNYLPNLKLVYTIYDLVMVKDNLRHLYYPNDALFDGYMTWISENCDSAIYCGHTAQIDAEAYFKQWGLNVPAGYWIKYGGDIKNQNFKSDEQKLLQNMGVKAPYVLAVGSFDHKKNYKVLYQAFCLLQQRNSANVPQLVIVGRTLANNELLDKIQNNPLTKEKIKLVSCSDEELNALYKNCEFALLPSLYEGYSVVLLETLQYGKLCLCSDTPPLREVGGKFAYFINPEHPKEWADAIETFIKDKSKVKNWEDKIHKEWKNISWKESTTSLYKDLTEIANKNNSAKEPVVYYDIGLLFYAGGLTGIPRTEMLLARYLNSYCKKIKYFFMSKGRYCELSQKQLTHLLSDENLDFAVAADRASIKGYLIKEQVPFTKNDIVFSAGVGYDKRSYSLLAAAHNKVGFKYCQVIYDLTPVTVPHTHPKDRVENEYPQFLHNTYTLSDCIVYGGKTAQSDGEKFQKDNGLKLKSSVAVKWGNDIVSRSLDKNKVKETMEKYGITGDFVLSVGTIEARKNQEILYEAYLELLKNNAKGETLPQIIICGHKGWKSEFFQYMLQVDARIRNKVILITPSDEELEILYRTCKFTLLPSFYEGWSLTLPESLNYGKFCLASDTPSLKEIGENIIDYANPYDPVEWAEKIKYYYNNKSALKNKEDLIKKKWHNTTWKQCAANLNTILSNLSA